MTVLKSPISVPAEVLNGLNAVRLSGLTNMLDLPRVREIADELGLEETVRWLDENRSDYSQGIFRGFVPIEPA